MKWTVLTDNRTQNPLLQTEHGHCTGDAVFTTLHRVMGDKMHAFSCRTRNIDL